MSNIGPTIQETLAFTIDAHGQQTRRGDLVPYYTHPVAVAKIADAICEALRIPDDIRYDVNRCGLLHDVVEDTPLTIMNIGKMGYSIGFLNSLYLVTKEEGQTHNKSVDEIILSEDIVALITKAADTYHNSVLTEDDVTWCRANNIDPEASHKRYLKSFGKLMTKIMEMYNRGDWYIGEQLESGTVDNAMNEMVKVMLKTDPYLKNLLDVVSSPDSSE